MENGNQDRVGWMERGLSGQRSKMRRKIYAKQLPKKHHDEDIGFFLVLVTLSNSSSVKKYSAVGAQRVKIVRKRILWLAFRMNPLLTWWAVFILIKKLGKLFDFFFVQFAWLEENKQQINVWIKRFNIYTYSDYFLIFNVINHFLNFHVERNLLVFLSTFLMIFLFTYSMTHRRIMFKFGMLRENSLN